MPGIQVVQMQMPLLVGHWKTCLVCDVIFVCWHVDGMQVTGEKGLNEIFLQYHSCYHILTPRLSERVGGVMIYHACYN